MSECLGGNVCTNPTCPTHGIEWTLDGAVGAPDGAREVRCALLSPHGAHGETFPDEPDRSWWCPGAVVSW